MTAASVALMVATAAVGLFAMAVAYARSRDPFHPLLFACPIAVFLYVYVPVTLDGRGMLGFFLPLDELAGVQAVFLAMLAAFCGGALAASGRARFDPRRRPLRLSAAAAWRVTATGIVLGCAGVAVWLALTLSRGGIERVYFDAYGGGRLHPSGWVRESVNLSLVGAVLCLAAGAGRPASWRWLLAVALASPQIVHAALGTRRGPAYVCAVLLLVGPLLFAGRRPRLTLTVAGGIALGTILLLLVANRQRIYYGSSKPLTLDVTSTPVLRADTGNEYLVGSALVLAAKRGARYGWGVSYVEELLVRPIPAALLPEKYDLVRQQTVTGDDIGPLFGWVPAYGAATTLFAHLFIEFAFAGIGVSALIGALFGLAWRRAVESPSVGWLVLQLLMLQGLLHLLAQDVWAMAVPFFLLLVPCWVALAWTLERPFRRLPARAAVPA